MDFVASAVVMTCEKAISIYSDSVEPLGSRGVTLGICSRGAFWAAARGGVLVESAGAVVMTCKKAIFKCSDSVEALGPRGVTLGTCSGEHSGLLRETVCQWRA